MKDRGEYNATINEVTGSHIGFAQRNNDSEFTAQTPCFIATPNRTES